MERDKRPCRPLVSLCVTGSGGVLCNQPTVRCQTVTRYQLDFRTSRGGKAYEHSISSALAGSVPTYPLPPLEVRKSS
jgi:hypothetical protein